MPNVSINKAPAGYVNAVLSPMPASISTWHDSSSRSAPLVFTYTFETSQPVDQWNLFTGWTAFTASQKASVRAVLSEFASMVNVAFTEVGTGAADPDFNFGRVNLSPGTNGQGGYRYTYFTDGNGQVTAKVLDGFAVFENSLATLSPNLILHEFGHALTLKHPGNYGGDSAPGGPFLPAALDNNKYSVMSYAANPSNGQVSSHLMLLDIAALQARFGANYTTRTGNDVYTGPQGPIQAIWDAGGLDRIDGTQYHTQLNIDLREGFFSTLGKFHNLAIAYGVIIENATGGTAKDALTGNQWGNTLVGRGGGDILKGNGGNDALFGNGGADFMAGGPGFDSFVFNSALNASLNVDRITDFAPYYDTIRLSRAVFQTLQPGVLPADAFHIGPVSADLEDRINYNRTTGALSYDFNGSAPGGNVKFAYLAPQLAVTNADFMVY